MWIGDVIVELLKQRRTNFGAVCTIVPLVLLLYFSLEKPIKQVHLSIGILCVLLIMILLGIFIIVHNKILDYREEKIRKNGISYETEIIDVYSSDTSPVGCYSFLVKCSYKTIEGAENTIWSNPVLIEKTEWFLPTDDPIFRKTLRAKLYTYNGKQLVDVYYNAHFITNKIEE